MLVAYAAAEVYVWVMVMAQQSLVGDIDRQIAEGGIVVVDVVDYQLFCCFQVVGAYGHVVEERIEQQQRAHGLVTLCAYIGIERAQAIRVGLKVGADDAAVG